MWGLQQEQEWDEFDILPIAVMEAPLGFHPDTFFGSKDKFQA